MAVNNYETVFIAEPEITTEKVDQLIGKIKSAVTEHKGTMTHEDRWGRRRLAYPIHGFREGFYVVLTFNSEGTVINALEHLFRVTDAVFRHMTVKVIKKNKTFPPRRVKPAGSAESSRPSGRYGHRDSRPSPAAAPAAPAAAPAAPSAESAKASPGATAA